jgi:hypothetical protein
MWSDICLIVVTAVIWLSSLEQTYTAVIDYTALSLPAYQLFWATLFAATLILCSIVDYLWNRNFYFGGKNDQRKQKFVFVCSPLSGDIKANILRAQWYSKTLMEEEYRFRRKIVPFASHAFFPYFLDDEVPADRILGRKCALAFLAACDAIYVYVPSVPNQGLRRLFKKRRLDRQDISSGMRHELEEAKKMGLEIQYRKRSNIPSENLNWKNWTPHWIPIDYKKEPQSKQGKENKKNQMFCDAPIKRVYVCTPFRGVGFDDLTPDFATLKKNTRMTLWCCHQLVRDEEELVAPFAPQAFFPYFWSFLNAEGKLEKVRWGAWFERSLEVLN